MKPQIYILLLATISFNTPKQKVSNPDTSVREKATTSTVQKNPGSREVCWKGTLNGKIPIFIHYQYQSDSTLLIGEITYLNTKNRLPIRLLGKTREDGYKNYRLLEFDETGYITGIIIGRPNGKKFNGSWYSTNSDKELPMALSLADTAISSPEIKPVRNQIFGNYHYQEGENGYSGDFEINKVGNDKMAFNIVSYTNVERGPNIAEVEKDTIEMKGGSFSYRISDSDGCEFKTTFYKDFLHINYTKGYCGGQFGLAATIEGIYLKTK